MASMRDIKRRIKSVQSTQQITKAMKMVAAAKFRRAQERVISARPFSKQLSEVLGRLVAVSKDYQHPLTAVREPQKVGYVVIAADRGLCGGYNANILRKAAGEMKQLDDVSTIAVGRKSRDFFRRAEQPMRNQFLGLGEAIKFTTAQEIAQTVMDAYISGEFDEVYLVFTEFKSALTQIPTTIKLLPIDPPVEEGSEVEYIYEPSAEEILNVLLPKYVETTVYRALLEAKASELGAQMTAMGAATDNATELIGKLTLSFNRARQAAITTELSEIVGGAAAIE